MIIRYNLFLENSVRNLIFKSYESIKNKLFLYYSFLPFEEIDLHLNNNDKLFETILRKRKMTINEMGRIELFPSFKQTSFLCQNLKQGIEVIKNENEGKFLTTNQKVQSTLQLLRSMIVNKNLSYLSKRNQFMNNEGISGIVQFIKLEIISLLYYNFNYTKYEYCSLQERYLHNLLNIKDSKETLIFDKNKIIELSSKCYYSEISNSKKEKQACSTEEANSIFKTLFEKIQNHRLKIMQMGYNKSREESEELNITIQINSKCLSEIPLTDYFHRKLEKIKEGSNEISIFPDYQSIESSLMKIFDFPLKELKGFSQIKVPFCELKLTQNEEKRTYIKSPDSDPGKITLKDLVEYSKCTEKEIKELMTDSFISAMAIAYYFKKFEYIIYGIIVGKMKYFKYVEKVRLVERV